MSANFHYNDEVYHPPTIPKSGRTSTERLPLKHSSTSYCVFIVYAFVYVCLYVFVYVCVRVMYACR